MVDRHLFILTVMLIGVGVLFAYSLSTYIVVLFNYNDFHFVIRQGVFALLSIVIIWALAQANPDKVLQPLGFLLFFGSLFFMFAMPFLPTTLVSEVGGAKRWIKIAGFSLAPVEFFKVGFIYFLAWSFSRKMGHHAGMGLKNEFIRFFPYALIFFIVALVIAVLQKDLGQVVVLSMTLLLLLMFAGSSYKFFLLILGTVLVAFVGLIVSAEHRINRILSWWSLAQKQLGPMLPDFVADKLYVESYSEPYQISHALNAIHNGGIFGEGLANGTFKLGFLSEVHTDFVLAGIAEEFGFIGVLFVCMLFVMILQRIFRIANRVQNDVYYLFSIGVGLLLAFTFIINSFGISGLTPIKGISVPFLSYGGSAMLAAAVSIGMVLMISKKVKVEEKS